MSAAAERCGTMGRTAKTRRRLRNALVGFAATGVAAALLASPALAAGAFFGNVTIRPAVHDSGRTLSGQGVEIVGPRASTGAGVIAMPINSLQIGGTPSARTAATLSFVHGKDSLKLSGIRFDLGKGTLEGSLAGRRLAVFRLGTPVDIDPTTGSVSFVGGRLRLTDAAARLLGSRFGLERALIHRGVGQVSMGATETTPLPPGCTPVTISPPYNRPPPPPEDCVPDPSPEPPPPPPVPTP